MSDDFVQSGQESAPSQPAETPAAPSPDLHTIKWNGQDRQVPYQDLVNYAQQGYDYTQKLQRFGSKEREYQGRLTQYEQALQEVRDFLSDRNRLQAYMTEAFKDAQQAQAPDPQEPITAQQLQQQLGQMTQAQQQQVMAQMQQLRQEMEVTQLAGTYTQQIDATIQGLMGAYPGLKSIPRVDKLLRDEVREREPQTIEQAKLMLREVAQDFARKQDEYLASQQKQSAAQAQPLRRGIEPAGGASPSAPPSPAFKSVTDARLRELVMQDLMQSANK